MKLGIVVVYEFGDDNAPLLSLHLEQIRKHTRIPYRIFGSANTLNAHLREKLDAFSEVSVCACPESPVSGSYEHAHYLDHLVRIAAASDVTHIATLHLDSFPVRSGWAEALAGTLSSTRVFATVERIHTACLLFHRDFYLEHRPPFRARPEQRDDPAFKEFLKTGLSIDHSGVTYAFAAYRNGLSWYSMPDTTAPSAGKWGRVYDDAIFHLGGAVRRGEQDRRDSGIAATESYRQLGHVAAPIGRRLPAALRSRIKRRLLSPRLSSERAELRASRERLLADPETYLETLRKTTRNVGS